MRYKDHVLSGKQFAKPVVFEVFIADEADEEKAYQLTTSLIKDESVVLKQNLKSAVKSVVGQKGISTIKSILKNRS